MWAQHPILYNSPGYSIRIELIGTNLNETLSASIVGCAIRTGVNVILIKRLNSRTRDSSVNFRSNTEKFCITDST